jgi:predicted ester cyclase
LTTSFENHEVEDEMNSELRQRRLEVLDTHFQSEVDHDWDTCLATFGGHARYEIMATGRIHDGDAEVLAYHRSQRVAFPDQRHENVRIHVADHDTVIAEFDLLGTNTGEFYGQEPTGKSFRVPVIAAFFFDGEHIVDERVYLGGASLIRKIGQFDLLTLAGTEVSLLAVDQ